MRKTGEGTKAVFIQCPFNIFQMTVEVERKFLCDADIKKTLESIRAVCIGQRRFHDQYFDTPDFDLTLKNVWLRRRQGCWELKSSTTPISRTEETSGGQLEEASPCTRYKEITNLPEIQLKVKEVLKDRCGCGKGEFHLAENTIKYGGNYDLQIGCRDKRQPVINQEDKGKKGPKPQEDDAWLNPLNLVCFAEFTTMRSSYTVEEHGVQVDLDQADFGYHVGEIEVLVPEGEDVGPALEKIGRVAQNLGLTGNQRVPGKMTAYLKRYSPGHYAKLLSAHIL